ncbi:MAG TPA: type I DNA topoisomerase [Turneriella sp.]|nr:type I DNA topoisomerase [Turneriella sp.]HNE19367.1 type I DNA topoisomerase [Turneriella sp.]HNJ65296.1 type I DNA topoisomerase [Turneriella sp.]HNL09051.1 type I DNA topoisomerase [Turneriella sp.]HNL55100.1 type I DNA topoisomerase [Turneriella sp.]
MAEKAKAKAKPKKTALVIVESPAKTKSIGKFLGGKYRVESSKGHLIDLPRSSMGIDIQNNFEPLYITIRGKGKTLGELRKAAKNSSEVLLATDPDREGEAISWHLGRALSEVNPKISRIEFNEITKEAVLKAVEHPREIDMQRVDSQQARRVLDRLVGYEISPVLQKKFGSRRFSAGRVQSAALKILCDREAEIEKFVAEEFWEFDGFFSGTDSKARDKETAFRLSQVAGKKTSIGSKDEAEALEKEILAAKYSLVSRKTSERRIKPLAPYITSRLQQDASTRLGFRAQKTMSIAQGLYEGVELGKEGSVGLITYMRTDSTRISATGLEQARGYIAANFEPAYLPEVANFYGKKKDENTQDAHEAIRPTDVTRTPESLEKFLDRDQYRLYALIWRRFVASQMAPGVDELVTLEVQDSENKFNFRYSSSRQTFTGFRAIYPLGDEKAQYVPNFNEGDSLKLLEFQKQQKFTQPPPRYTEASLIKAMEESGIGRPATYVPTIGTLDKRAYIERKGRQLIPTKLGRVVNDIMAAHFPDIVDLKFTANMEEKLDSIAQGQNNWRQMLGDFYPSFHGTVERAGSEIADQTHLVRIPLGRECPKCGHELMQKLGKNGYFIGCSNFQGGCRFSESIPLGTCPLCGGSVVKKKGKKGRGFFGCANYSTTGCEFTMLETPAKRTCPKCNSIMGQKVRKTGITLTCQNPECKHTIEETAEETPGENPGAES